MNKINAELKNGILELTVIESGKLILGEYKGEKTFTYELQKALKRSGIITGYLNNCLNLIESGSAGQIPVAQAFIEDEPGELVFHFGKKWQRKEIIELLSNKDFNSINFFYQAKKGEKLVSFVSTPNTVLKYPNGKIEVLHELSFNDMEYYAGKHVSVDPSKRTLLADIDGLPQKEIFGVVSVFPESRVKSIGKAHGRVHYDTALHVEQDIRSESDVSSLGGIRVGGMVRSSRLEAGGNIHIKFGFDNPKKSEAGYAESGQSVFTSAIRNYRVKAAFSVVSNTAIEGSWVDCLGTIITPQIRSSEIKVGNKLFVNEVTGNSQIYLGPYFIKESKYTELKNFHQQHIKRLYDLESETRIIMDKIRHGQRIALLQIQKLKKLTPDNFQDDVLLNRYLQNMNNLHLELEGSIKKYEKQIALINKERMRLSYFERQFFNTANTEIICPGTMEQGTVINAPNESLKLKESRKNISVKLDTIMGTLIISDL